MRQTYTDGYTHFQVKRGLSPILSRYCPQYIQAAMRYARYEQLDQGEGYYGEIPVCQGTLANVPTLEACRDQFAEVAEDWIILRLACNLPLPIVGNLGASRPRGRPMPLFGPVSRRDVIRYLNELVFGGPFSGMNQGADQVVRSCTHRSHRKEIGPGLAPILLLAAIPLSPSDP
jgi:hypothetical protein